MNRYAMVAMCVVLGLCAVSFGAEEGKKKGGDPEASFKKKDKDGDGLLTFEEFKGKASEEKAKGLEKRFKSLDKNADGKLSLEEYKAGSGGGKEKSKDN